MIFFGRIGSPRSEANGFTPAFRCLCAENTQAASDYRASQYSIFGNSVWAKLLENFYIFKNRSRILRPNPGAVKHEYCGGLWSIEEKLFVPLRMMVKSLQQHTQ
jgi:hypothetical protein